MTTELFVSLGHNSSAAIAVDGVVVAAYEQERMDRRKASSAYPREAVHACLHATGHGRVDATYVSHWFDRFALDDSKYLDLADLSQVSGRVVGLDPDLTHHDAHARSALAFARCHGVAGETTVVVMDGFGNRQECFSVYDGFRGQQLRLRHRTYGYAMSLGLMYQYATDYLGLKQNQDEYKLLGYESRILRHIDRDAALAVGAHVRERGEEHGQRMSVATRYPFNTEGRGGLIDFGALESAKARWHGECREWLRLLEGSGLDASNPQAVRAGVAFCAQSFLESATMRAILEATESVGASLVLTGGSFYNVKLNRHVTRTFDVPTLCHPLAGDQGAAMGATHSPPQCYDLLLGPRDLTALSGHAVNRERWIDVVAGALEAGHVVDVVRGSMEFGPRALCDTTTFALPTAQNVALINSINERDDAMPMAPVMTQAAARHYLDERDVELAGQSLRYMITTCALRRRPPDRIRGVAHPDPLDGELWTVRPQVTDDPELVSLLERFPDETLINTSFNYHGEPIVHTLMQAIETHGRQLLRARPVGLGGVDLVVVP